MRTPVSALINAVLSFTSFVLSAEFVDELDGVRELFYNHSVSIRIIGFIVSKPD